MKRALLILLLLAHGVAAQTITVDVNTSHQTIGYWEAAGEAGREDFADWDDYKTSLLDQMAADGINRIKINMRLNTERASPGCTGGAVNDNADPFSINAAGFCWTRVDLFADVADMLCDRLAAEGKTCKKILGYVDFGNNTGFLHTSDAEEYAELIEAAFIHLNATYGWVPDMIEVILEPDHGSNSNWTATKLVNSILSTQSRLAGHGWNPRFVVPSVTNGGNLGAGGANWWGAMRAVNTTWLQYVDEGSYHHYGSPTDTMLNQNQTAVEADGKRLAMLEWADTNSDYTILHALLKRNGMSYEQFTAAYDNTDNGHHYYVVNHTTHAVTIGSRTKLLRQYFKWIQPGAVRKATSSNDANIDGLCFRNVGGNHTCPVKALASGNINIVGLPAGTYHIRYTTAAVYDQNPGDQTIGAGGTISTSIPAAGVLTVFADATVSTPQVQTSGKVFTSGKVALQ